MTHLEDPIPEGWLRQAVPTRREFAEHERCERALRNRALHQSLLRLDARFGHSKRWRWVEIPPGVHQDSRTNIVEMCLAPHYTLGRTAHIPGGAVRIHFRGEPALIQQTFLTSGGQLF